MSRVARCCAPSLVGLLQVLCGCSGPPSSPASPQVSAASATATLECKTLDYSKHPSTNQLNGINNRDVIVGGDSNSAYVIDPPHRQQDYRIENYPGGLWTYGAGTSDNKILVGYYGESGGGTRGFFKLGVNWTGVSYKQQTTELLGINNAGAVVGFYIDRHGVDHGFMLNPRFHEVKPPGGISVAATGINGRREIVGYATTSSGATESFLLKDRRYTEYSYPDSSETEALAINRDDEIVGSYVDATRATHGFILRDPISHPRWQSFDAPKSAGFTRLTGVNDNARLVGSYRDGSGVMHGLVCR